MSNRRNNSTLGLSNPFKHRARKQAFDETVRVLSDQFPQASLDWVRRHAWARARKVPVPGKRRAA